MRSLGMPIMMLVVLLMVTLACGSPGTSGVGGFGVEYVKASDRCIKAECKDFAHRTKEKSLSKADKANGLEGRWCVRVEYAYKLSEADRWQDGHENYIVSKHNGQYSVDKQFDVVFWDVFCK